MVNIYPVIPHLQVRNSSIILYFEYDKPKSSKLFDIVENNKEIETYSGGVTKSTEKRIKKAVDILIQCSIERKIFNEVIKKNHMFRLSFMTLTLSEQEYFVSGKEAYANLLKPFLDWLRKTKHITTYIWKAERQSPIDRKGVVKKTKGQLHYHLTIPYFINYTEIKEKWNYLQRQSHYLNGFKNTYGHDNPNSVDIHSVYSVNDLEGYLVKYISKESYTHIQKDDGSFEELPKNKKGKHYLYRKLQKGEKQVLAIDHSGKLEVIDTKIDGKIWDCSKNLKGVRYFEIEGTEFNKKELEYMSKVGSVVDIKVEHGKMWSLKNIEDRINFLDIHQRDAYYKWKDGIRETIYNDKNV